MGGQDSATLSLINRATVIDYLENGHFYAEDSNYAPFTGYYYTKRGFSSSEQAARVIAARCLKRVQVRALTS